MRPRVVEQAQAAGPTAADISAVAARFRLTSTEAGKLPEPGSTALACWQHGNPQGCTRAKAGQCRFDHIGEPGSSLAQAAAALSRGRFDSAVARSTNAAPAKPTAGKAPPDEKATAGSQAKNAGSPQTRDASKAKPPAKPAANPRVTQQTPQQPPTANARTRVYAAGDFSTIWEGMQSGDLSLGQGSEVAALQQQLAIALAREAALEDARRKARLLDSDDDESKATTHKTVAGSDDDEDVSDTDAQAAEDDNRASLVHFCVSDAEAVAEIARGRFRRSEQAKAAREAMAAAATHLMLIGAKATEISVAMVYKAAAAAEAPPAALRFVFENIDIEADDDGPWDRRLTNSLSKQVVRLLGDALYERRGKWASWSTAPRPDVDPLESMPALMEAMEETLDIEGIPDKARKARTLFEEKMLQTRPPPQALLWQVMLPVIASVAEEVSKSAMRRLEHKHYDELMDKCVGRMSGRKDDGDPTPGNDDDCTEADKERHEISKLRDESLKASLALNWSNEQLRRHDAESARIKLMTLMIDAVRDASKHEASQAAATGRAPRQIHMCMDPACTFHGTIETVTAHENKSHNGEARKRRERVATKPLGLPNIGASCALSVAVKLVEIAGLATEEAIAKDSSALGRAITNPSHETAHRLAGQLALDVGRPTSVHEVVEGIAARYPKVQTLAVGALHVEVRCRCGTIPKPALWRGERQSHTTIEAMVNSATAYARCSLCGMETRRPQGNSDCLWVDMEDCEAPLQAVLRVETGRTRTEEFSLVAVAYALTKNHAVTLFPATAGNTAQWLMADEETVCDFVGQPRPSQTLIAVYAKTKNPTVMAAPSVKRERRAYAGEDDTAQRDTVTQRSVSGARILSWNVRALSDDKIIEVLSIANQTAADVLAMQEIGANWPRTFDALFERHGYVVVSRDQRAGQKGGGAAVAVRKNGTRARKWDLDAPQGIECAGVQVCVDGKRMNIISLYWPPPGAHANTMCSSADMGAWLASMVDAKTIIAGDFNARHAAWCDKSHTADTYTKQRATMLLKSGWRVANVRPGIPTVVAHGTTPDVILCGASIYGGAWVPTAAVNTRPRTSDHRPLLGHFAHDFVPRATDSPTTRDQPKKSKVKWTPANTTSFAKRLNSDRLFTRRKRSPQATATTHRRLVAALHRAAATVCGKGRKTWRLKKAGTSMTRRGAKTRRLKMKKFIRAAPNHVAMSVLLGKTAGGAGALLGNSEEEMRETLLAQTVNLHANPPARRADDETQREDGNEAPQPRAERTRRSSIPAVTTDEALAALGRHPRGKAADDDGVTADMLAAVRHAPRAVEFIRAMATDALKNARAPITWRRATTIPLLKAGKDATVPSNYRPVAITSYISRTVERVALHRMLPDLQKLREGKHVRQMAYLSGTSTRKMTASLLHDVRTKIAKKHSCGYALLFDFSSAFCRVQAESCGKAFDTLGIAGYLRDWVTTWMSNRETRVRLPGDEKTTRWARLDRGCPQGSVLGPFVWLAAVESLRHRLDTLAQGRNAELRGVTMRATLFADDLSVFMVGAAGVNLRGYGASAARADCTTGTHSHATDVYTAVLRWAAAQGIEVSSKTKAHMLHSSPRPPAKLKEVIVGNAAPSATAASLHTLTPEQSDFNNLGMRFSHDLTQSAHAAWLCDELASVTHALSALRHYGRHPASNVEAYETFGLAKARYGTIPELLSKTDMDSLEQAHAGACRQALGLQASTSNALATRAAGLRALSEILAIQDALVDHVNDLREVNDGCTKTKDRHTRLYPAHAAIAEMRVFRMEYEGKKSDLTETGQHTASARNIAKAKAEMTVGRLGNRRRLVLATDGSVDGAGSGHARSAAAWLVLTGTMPRPAPRDDQEEGSDEQNTQRVYETETDSGSPTDDEPTRLAAGCIPVGPCATSYSAEAVAGLNGLRAALSQPLEQDETGIDVLWITDSLSLLDRLEKKGPVLEDDDLIADIHEVRAAHPTCRIFATHVFSHCGVAENEEADSLAKAVEGQTVSWWNDTWRLKKQQMEEAFDAGVEKTISDRQRRPAGPPKMVTAAEAKWISQLKCGVCSPLGGNLHGEAEDCYNCGAREVLKRGGDAVRHMFTCSAMEEERKAILGKDIATDDEAIDTLWTAPRKAIEYAKRFWKSRPTRPRYGADEGEDSSSDDAAEDSNTTTSDRSDDTRHAASAEESTDEDDVPLAQLLRPLTQLRVHHASSARREDEETA